MSFFSSLGGIAGSLLGGPLGGAVGSSLGGLIGGSQSHQAGAQANQGAIRGANLDQSRWNQIQGMEQPWMQGGGYAQGALNNSLGIGPNSGSGGYGSALQPYHFGQSAPGQFNYTGQQAPGAFTPTAYKQFTQNDFYNNSPSYKFQKEQGMQGVLNGASAGSGAMSGAAQKDLMGYNQGLANSAWDNAFSQNMAGQQQRFAQQQGQYQGQLAGYNSQYGNQLSGFGANMGRYLDMNNQNFNQYNTQQGNIYNRLLGVSAMGQQATGQAGGYGTQLGMDQAQGYTNAGAASAWGTQNAGQQYAGIPAMLGSQDWSKVPWGGGDSGGGELPTDPNTWDISDNSGSGFGEAG